MSLVRGVQIEGTIFWHVLLNIYSIKDEDRLFRKPPFHFFFRSDNLSILDAGRLGVGVVFKNVVPGDGVIGLRVV